MGSGAQVGAQVRSQVRAQVRKTLATVREGPPSSYFSSVGDS